MPTEWILVLAAVVAGWLIQLVVSYRQSMSFNAEARALRASGAVSVGAGGRRYRGGRAFVALATDDGGVVRDAIALTGFTTFARAKKVPQLVGLRVNRVKGDRDIDGLSVQVREAARQAATLARRPSPADRATQEVVG
jgi:DNA-binding transcriptional regulator of glucitol operon